LKGFFETIEEAIRGWSVQAVIPLIIRLYQKFTLTKTACKLLLISASLQSQFCL